MSTLPFLHQIDFNVTNISVFSVTSAKGRQTVESRHKGRMLSGLVYTLSGAFRYISEKGISFVSSADSVVLLPEGSKYTHTALEDSRTIVVNFKAVDENLKSLVLSSNLQLIPPGYAGAFQSKFQDLQSQYERNIPTPALMKITLYQLLLDISKIYMAPHYKSSRYSIIKPALEYLQNGSLHTPVKELSGMCGLSENCFRRMFKEETGRLPSEFMRSLVINKALSYLSDLSLTVSEISELLNFSDVSSFSRFLKRYTGQAPLKIRESHKARDFL